MKEDILKIKMEERTQYENIWVTTYMSKDIPSLTEFSKSCFTVEANIILLLV